MSKHPEHCQLSFADSPPSCLLSCEDPVTVLSFLTSLLSRIDTEKSPEAHVLLLSSLAHAKLLYGDLEGTQTDMETAWKILDDLDGVDPAVNAAYYSVAADYYKVRLYIPWGPPCLFLQKYIGKGGLRSVLQELSPLSCVHRSCSGSIRRGKGVTSSQP